ncbi:hypothetical protein CBR_g12242 [Chara braunii]|uniref:Uncharacterized protein n=1 Tax=Chara braunii TaxID=69332 RepID=A0A388KRH4_CHABU|nr:hypothetical protein CBR_g12242 [Chara braunii]|eukprot:GBG72671.1 hypothetical protein CBR_g12242 [Chara braunii]
MVEYSCGVRLKSAQFKHQRMRQRVNVYLAHFRGQSEEYVPGALQRTACRTWTCKANLAKRAADLVLDVAVY